MTPKGDPERKHEVPQNDEDKRESQPGDRPPIGRLPGNLSEVSQSEDGRGRKQSKSALRRVGDWSRKPKTWVEVLTMLFVGYYAFLTHQLVGISNTQLKLSQRPWIQENISLASPLRFDDAHGRVQVKIVMKNAGRSVAVNVHPFCQLGAERSGEAALIEFAEQACGGLGKQTTDNPQSGYVMFPDDSLSETDEVTISQDEIAAAIKANETAAAANPDRSFIPVMVCCVDYRFPLEPQHHQTRQLYKIVVPDQARAGTFSGVQPRGTASAAVLAPEFWGNSAD